MKAQFLGTVFSHIYLLTLCMHQRISCGSVPFTFVPLPRYARHIWINLNGSIAQSVVSPTADPRVAGSIRAGSH